MKKVVVTGATSMIGVALIEQCIRNDVEVLALVRSNSSNVDRIPKSDLITIVDCDLAGMRILNYSQDTYDVFYHFGWSHTDKEGRMNIDFQMENIQYTIDALELAKRLGCKKFVASGSQAEYGIHTDEVTAPDSKERPQNAYGICKLAAGQLCRLKAKAEGIDCIWVRVFSVYGKYEMEGTLLNIVIPKMLRNERCLLSKCTQKWDYLYSEDAGRAFYFIGEKAKGNKVYCLGSGQARSLKEYLEEIKTFLQSDSELVYGAVLTNDSKGMCASIDALTADIGWKPEIAFLCGIEKKIKNYHIR